MSAAATFTEVGPRRSAIRRRCEERIAQGEAIILGSASAGIITQAASAAGIDLLLAYNIGVFRMDGHGSMVGYLPYADANGMTLELARHVLPVAGDVPVIAGVAAGDPYRDMSSFVDQLVGVGYAGVTNTPTSGVYDGVFRETIEKQGFGYHREVELVALCAERDVPTVAYAFTPDEARDMTRAGADILTVHLGLTGSGAAAALDDAVGRTRALCEAALSVRQDVLLVAHGGPLENATAVARVLAEAPVVGYMGGSSLERLPVGAAVKAAVTDFRSLRLAKA